jgi:SAM-dependent methyltransferase
MQTQTGSAIDSWQQRWATEEGRADWIDAHPAVVALLPELRARGARRALDLGCGVGRHALALAAAGFEVEAFDGAESGLGVLRGTAAARGLSVGLKHGNADALPYPDASFDYVLSWNVIYHGTLGDVGRRVAEIWRVLKPGGLYQGTMLPPRNSNYGVGRLVAPGTYVADGGPDAERSHPHFYCDAAMLVALFSGFELLNLSQEEQQKPGSWHWHIVAERLAG